MRDTVYSDDRKKAYFNPEGKDKPMRSPVPHAVLERARDYRRQRMLDQVIKHDCAAILMYDPLNIRYTFDLSNMQLWYSKLIEWPSANSMA